MKSKLASEWGSRNNTIWEEYLSIAILSANCIILLITSCVGIAANLFVTWAVYHQKSLRTWNNALLVNLAVIDILRCAVDCPILFTIITTEHQRGHVDEVLCNAQVASFSFNCSIQLLTLACISAERYQAIAFPFKNTERRRRIIVLIPVTWTLAIIVSVLCIIFVKDSPVYVICHGSEQESILSYDTFGLYVLFPLWISCFGVIIGFYASIFALVRSHSRKIFDKGTNHASKKENTKKVAEGGETVHKDLKQIQIQKENAAPLEQGAQAEPNSFQKDSAALLKPAALLNSAVESPHVLKDSQSKNESKPTVETMEGPPETEQDVPPVEQVELNSSNNHTKDGPKSVITESQGIVNVDSKHEPGAKVQMNDAEKKRPTSSVIHVKPNEDTISVIEPQKNNVDNTIESKAPVQIVVEQHNPDLLPTGPLDSPVAPSAVPPVEQINNNGEEAQSVAKADKGDVSDQTTACVANTAAVEQAPEVDGAVCMMPSLVNKERANKKKESKMAKRSGYIIFSFLLCWLPLIATILVNFLVYQNRYSQIRIVHNMEILCVSFACMTSLCDPIIYAAVNPQFRTEYYRLRNKIKSFWKKR